MRSMDTELHRGVLAELESEPSLRGQEIGVAAEEGVVTLSGYVDSCDHKHVAERAAARVSGVDAVADELRIRAPGPRDQTDTEIAHAVVNHLRSRDVRLPRFLIAKVEGGYVTLVGEVELFHDKWAVEEGISALGGVRGVINLITVKPPELVEDIKSKIESALVQRARRRAGRISVETDGSKVTLSGTVSSFLEEQEALKAARSVRGVDKVEGRLEITGD
ncbi:MAG: BON domain-containing protein [Gemmatimonadota bacterium]|nr:MAG: BON domain-containing protein [Gemmatimonadota bacterium]